ncbi:hypothetical protein AVEN_160754-1, partial [Araneus ventricosus]
MTRTTRELAPLLQTSTPHQREDVGLYYDLAFNRSHKGGSSMQSDFEPGTLWPRSRDLTTRPPRPLTPLGDSRGVVR